MRTDIAQPVRLSDYRAPDFLIDEVRLDARLQGAETTIDARLKIRRNPAGRPGAPLVLDGDELVVVSVELDETPLDLAEVARPDRLTVPNVGDGPFTLRIVTQLDPASNTKLMGLYRSGSAYCTQCEAEGFRRITYFLDRPDVLSVYTTRIEADLSEAPVLLGNGNLVESGRIAGSSRHYAVWHDPWPKPCYLFALVGGDLGVVEDTLVTASGREVKLGIYVEHGKEDRAGYAMDALKRSMLWDEKAFGREYDLDVFNIVAVSDFNMGAMENKGLNIFNDKYVLALPQTATDMDYAHIEGVIAHEYFHNWTGNRFTCRDWFQLCLKEGLTVFRDQEFSSDERSRSVKRIMDVRTLRAAQFPEDAGPLAHNVRPETYLEINNFYTPTVYEKGAEIIRMLKLMIGDDAFRRGMDLYFERCDGTAAVVEDFLACFAEASGRDLTKFKRWYTQAGTPGLTVKTDYDAEARRFTLDFEQMTAPTSGQPLKEALVIPIALGLIAEDGSDIPLVTPGASSPGGANPREAERGVFELAEPCRRIIFENVPSRPIPSLLRGFSAPVNVHATTSDDDLLILLAHDSDMFNRWQAAQTCATRWILRAVKAIRAGEAIAHDDRLADAMGAVVARYAQDPAFTAQVIVLPSEADIAREISRDVDPDAVHQARRALRRLIGDRLGDSLKSVYDALVPANAYSPDAASAGRRALRNAALDLIAAADPQEGAKIAEAQFRAANNMTDQIGALAVLSHIPGEARESALDSFFRAHASDALVVDKWFALQATIPERETLARVRRLMTHHAFSITNPNRLRSLIGMFAGGNQTQFNAPDGSGYDLVADTVIEVDPKNPQIAARLLASFRSWRSLESKRGVLAEAALRRVAQQPELSPDVRDIVERSLRQ
ncbi:MAG: aminopeptidase N [Beijerinckiaceae bacterium]|nr:aminopeptidase N [Beijerinckiaceae bacterium]